MLTLCAALLVQFSIAQQGTLSDQIQLWSLQAPHEITWGIDERIPARHGVQGLYTPDEALCQLLKDSPAEYIKVGTSSGVVRPKGQPDPEDDGDGDYCDPPPKTIHLDATPAGTSLASVLDKIRFNPANHVSILYVFMSSPPDYAPMPTRAAIQAGDYTVKDALCAVLAGTGFTFDTLDLESPDTLDFESPRHLKVYWERGTDTLVEHCAPLVWDTPDIQVPVADWK